MRMRQVPELDFRDDRSMEYAVSIARALKELDMQPAAKRAKAETES
jgi:ribosome-binding factor A